MSTPRTDALKTEMETFRRERERLLADLSNIGHFALVHGDQVAGIYSSYDAALSVGYEKFGLEPFLVKEIVEVEQPKYFSRNLR